MTLIVVLCNVFVLSRAGVISILTLRSTPQGPFHVFIHMSSCVLEKWRERERGRGREGCTKQALKK